MGEIDKAVTVAQDWSDREHALHEIAKATESREGLGTRDAAQADWVEKQLHRAAETVASDESP
jgi:hypothetical protein